MLQLRSERRRTRIDGKKSKKVRRQGWAGRQGTCCVVCTAARHLLPPVHVASADAPLPAIDAHLAAHTIGLHKRGAGQRPGAHACAHTHTSSLYQHPTLTPCATLRLRAGPQLGRPRAGPP